LGQRAGKLNKEKVRREDLGLVYLTLKVLRTFSSGQEKKQGYREKTKGDVVVQWPKVIDLHLLVGPSNLKRRKGHFP